MHPGLVTLIGVVIVSGVLFTILISGTDDSVSCESPETVSRFRGVGIGAGTIYTRALARKFDLDPPQTSPDPDLVSWIFSPPGVASVQMPVVSNLLWAWLQFIGDDVSLTRTAGSGTIFGGSTAPALPRNSFVLDSRGNRQQINYASPYIDLSQIYGNDVDAFEAIRRNDGSGKIKTVFTPNQPIGDDEMPVYNETTLEFIHLDRRYDDNPVLMALYVLFVREHNYWATTLAAEEPHLNERELFNIARHITIAEVQSITYNQFLPLLVGDDASKYSGTCFTDPSFRNDEDDIAEVVDEYLHRTTVYNEWAVAGLPIYQTLMPNAVDVRDVDNTTVTGSLNIMNDTKWAPYAWTHGIGGVLLGAARQTAQLRDIEIANSVRLRNGITLDRAAIQIARARDHQIPPYQAFYDFFFSRRAVDCERIAYNTDLCIDVEAVYSADNNFDLLTGLLAERQNSKTILGPVATELFIKQFGLIRRNDYYFYLWDKIVSKYRMDIYKTTLSKIIARNTNIARIDLQKNAFKIQV
jgi:hypothetical protein